MRSRLYECQVMHHRFAPKAHRFAYRIFMFAIDLDELGELDRTLRLFSVGRTNFYSFREADYFPTDEERWKATTRRVSAGSESAGGLTVRSDPGAPVTARSTLKSRVLAYLDRHGVDLTGGRVELITLPRVAGYLFNPVSFYFCYDRGGAPVAAVPEVTNTFREMKPFFLGPSTRSPTAGPADAFRRRVPKHFYVSPFSDVDVAFDFTLQPPGERLSIQIDDYVGGERTLTSTLTGRARPLTDGTLAALTLRHPLVPLHTIARIHWHALRLWLKQVPWFPKAARIADQRDLYRPHSSLSRTRGAPADPSSPHPTAQPTDA